MNHLRLVDSDSLPSLIVLLGQLNPGLSPALIETRCAVMLDNRTGKVFGLFSEDEQMLGCATVWITDRIYCGRQAELDNVVIDAAHRSKGLGAVFLCLLEDWAKRQGCLTVELNSYVDNVASHRFYERHGYHWLGRHYQKML